MQAFVDGNGVERGGELSKAGGERRRILNVSVTSLNISLRSQLSRVSLKTNYFQLSKGWLSPKCDSRVGNLEHRRCRG